LKRDSKQTLGFLFFSNGLTSVKLNTLELSWKENKSDISCIPAGTYNWIKSWSPKHKMYVIRLLNVPGRGDIEIHIANFFHDLLGCIAVGIGILDIDHDGEVDVTSSAIAFKALMDALPSKGQIYIDETNLITV
jgi:hypothetical protein